MTRNNKRLRAAETYDASALTDSLFDAHLAGWDAASVVTDAMVARAEAAWSPAYPDMRAALTAALAPEPT